MELERKFKAKKGFNSIFLNKDDLPIKILKLKRKILTFCVLFHRFNKREEAQEAISALNNVIPQGGNQPLIVRVAEEHGRAKAALYLPAYNSFNSQNRGRLRIRNQPY